MLVLYNFFQLVALIVVAPLLFVKVILTPKYRGRMAGRLGIGLKRRLDGLQRSVPCFWVHALSVGEVSSSRSLVLGLRQKYPGATIVYSSATRSGMAHARKVLNGAADVFVPFPLDLYWSVRAFVRVVRPDFFVLVETDFWPNLLHVLRAHRVPSLLVNGRISPKSLRLYQRLPWLFLPLFRSFSFLSMQTRADAAKMIELGVAPCHVQALGNLKYGVLGAAIPVARPDEQRRRFGLAPQGLVWVAGSTHAGEEEIVLRVFGLLAGRFPGLFLVMAPRDVARAGEITKRARALGLKAFLRSGPLRAGANVLVIDTLGELAGLYAICDIAFVGGSLVPEGGHNPLEPAGFAKPVLFGPHMDDFAEISEDILRAGGGVVVHNEGELAMRLGELLADPAQRRAMGKKARALVRQERQGVTERHLAVIDRILRAAPGRDA